MNLLTLDDVNAIIAKHSLRNIFTDLITYLEEDFKRWEAFQKSPRYASHHKKGVVELMPTSDGELFAYKYVNGHPANTAIGKPTVLALGQLSDMETGIPLLLSEMTILTAIRTAATAAMAAKYMSRPNSKTMAIIGTGAQSEFEAIAHTLVRPIETIKYFDIDQNAMDKFRKNLSKMPQNFVPCTSAKEAVSDADIIILLTAAKESVHILDDSWVKEGTYIGALGGDCPGKTELPASLLRRSRIVIEHRDQSIIEGEIQLLTPDEQMACDELWEVIRNQKPGRINEQEVTVFDSVGFAIEDFSILRLFYDLSCQYSISHNLPMIPQMEDPKDLFSLIC